MLNIVVTGKQFVDFSLRMEDEFYIEDLDAINVNVSVYGTQKFQDICNECGISWLYGCVMAECIMENVGLTTCSVAFEKIFKDESYYEITYNTDLMTWEILDYLS